MKNRQNMDASLPATGPSPSVEPVPVSPPDGASVPSAERRAVQLLRLIVNSTHSHIDGRDLLAELHPRRQLDIKRRVDGVETWFEGDWLSDVHREVERSKAFLFSYDIAAQKSRENVRTTRLFDEQEAIHATASGTEARQGGDGEAAPSRSDDGPVGDSRDAQQDHPDA